MEFGFQLEISISRQLPVGSRQWRLEKLMLEFPLRDKKLKTRFNGISKINTRSTRKNDMRLFDCKTCFSLERS